jgi:acetate kinase
MSGRETKDVRASEAVAVRVICTDEEWMIANTVCRVLGLIIEKGNDHEDKEGV